MSWRVRFLGYWGCPLEHLVSCTPSLSSPREILGRGEWWAAGEQVVASEPGHCASGLRPRGAAEPEFFSLS